MAYSDNVALPSYAEIRLYRRSIVSRLGRTELRLGYTINKQAAYCSWGLVCDVSRLAKTMSYVGGTILLKFGKANW